MLSEQGVSTSWAKKNILGISSDKKEPRIVKLKQSDLKRMVEQQLSQNPLMELPPMGENLNPNELKSIYHAFPKLIKDVKNIVNHGYDVQKLKMELIELLNGLQQGHKNTEMGEQDNIDHVGTGLGPNEMSVDEDKYETLLRGPKKSMNEQFQMDEKLKKTNEDVYFDTYTGAVGHAMKVAKEKGYTLDQEEIWNKIATGDRKPPEGQTVSHHLSLFKDGQKVKEMLHIQVYGMSKSYELNFYIN